jgi:hypothetical protein
VNKSVPAGIIELVVAFALGLLAGSWLTGRELEWFGRPLAYPHVVPKSKDVVSLRFAMVHDVLHERFPKHGKAWYLERNRLVSKKLDGKLGDPALEPLVDDLAVGLEFAGDHDGAIRLLRDKLKRQLDRGDSRAELYSTYSNLGTFLILGPFRQVRPGNAEDKATLREGLGYIHAAIEINPDSHFGREAWQAAIIEYMIALYENPWRLLQVDMIGNNLNEVTGGGGPMGILDGFFGRRDLGGAREATEYLAGNLSWEQAREARIQIATVRVTDEKRVPFDEPTLGIIGMWRLGGGAHPYFAVALGETMLRVNQPYLAWNAYERAGRMAELTWPDPGLQAKFRDHCNRRQTWIEERLPAAEVARLRPAFAAELAVGEAFQRDYQRFEEEQIAAGKSIEDPKFYDAFWKTHPPIATPVGSSDWFTSSKETGGWSFGLPLLTAGLATFATGLWIRLRRRKASPAA